MTDLVKTPIDSKLIVERLQGALTQLHSNLTPDVASSIPLTINEVYNTLSDYFTNISEIEFNPDHLLTNDSPSSEVYNNNLLAIHRDITRFYKELENLTNLQVKSYNYAYVVNQDIINKAAELASMVLDLNILNNFNRGDTIVAGDDFINQDNIDLDVATGAEQAELLPGGGGIALARNTSVDLVDTNTKVDIIPISPAESSSSNPTVNTAPTPGNFQRFYEGNYYNFLGMARPEGDQFNIKFLLESNSSDPVAASSATNGVLVDLGASEEEKAATRLRMFDKNPSTFWECEYLYKVDTPLLSVGIESSDIVKEADEAVLEPDNSSSPATGTVVIDLKRAELAAQQFDLPGRDLIIDLVITFKEVKTVNFVTINPLLFGADAYPEIVDISTTSVDDGTFVTVDGWESLKFAKFLTPEANEFLTDSQTNAILAPNRSSFSGQGIFPFPARDAKKIKIRIKAATPVACPYEKIYALMTNNTKTTITTTVTKKKGLLR